MLFTVFVIIGALAGGTFLLALASDAFAHELSRGVEAAFDYIEYRGALRRARKAETARGPQRGGRAALVRLRVS